jgi:hypothetical protein
MLRAIGEVKAGGEIDSVSDFYLDDLTWSIRYVVVDTGTWLAGRPVLISRMFSEPIEAAPEYDPSRPFRRKDEARLIEHHARRTDWEFEGRA